MSQIDEIKPKVPAKRQQDEDFILRLTDVIGGQSNRSFSKDIDVSEGTIRKYLAGSLPMGIDIFIAIAKKRNISLNWLLLGVGPKEL